MATSINLLTREEMKLRMKRAGLSALYRALNPKVVTTIAVGKEVYTSIPTKQGLRFATNIK